MSIKKRIVTKHLCKELNLTKGQAKAFWSEWGKDVSLLYQVLKKEGFTLKQTVNHSITWDEETYWFPFASMIRVMRIQMQRANR